MSSTKIIISISSSLILIITAIIILWVSGVFKSEETKLAENCALNCDPISPIFSKEHCQQNCGSNCINCSYKWGTHLPYTSIPISQNNVVYTTTTVVPETTTTVVPTTTTTVVPETTTTVVPTTTTNSIDSLINSLLSPLPIVNTVDAPKDCASIEPGWSASSVISGGSVTKVCPYGTATATCDNGVLTKGSCPAPKDCTSIEPGWSASSVISGGSVTKTCPYGTATATCDNGVLTKGACPAIVIPLMKLSRIAGGGRHTVAINSSGQVHSWGNNTYGQLGKATPISQSSVPVNVSSSGSLSGQTIVAVSCGNDHTVALSSSGQVHAWGHNLFGQLGNGSVENSIVPINISSFGSLSGQTIVAVSCGSSYTVALSSSGQVHIWGSNYEGNLGNNTVTQSTIPINISSFGSLSGQTIVAIAGGGSHTIALSISGQVHAWGYNKYGQLGNGTVTQSRIPIVVSSFGSLSGQIITEIGNSYDHTVALSSSGQVHTWGRNIEGQLGNNTTTQSSIPINVSSFGSLLNQTISTISPGNYHTVALSSSGQVHTWGSNGFGQLGNNTVTRSNIPIVVSSFGSLSGQTIVSIAGGGNHTVARDSSGKIHTWGYNIFGQLGNGTVDNYITTNSNIPINVTSISTL